MPLPRCAVRARLPLALACVLALVPAALAAQPRVEPGARVRILAPSTADTLITGTVVAIDSARLLLAARFDTAGVHVPLSAIRRLEVAARRSGTQAGLWGLLLGGAAGYALFSGCGHADACTDTRTVGTVGGAVLGMLLGNLFGGGGEEWRTVPVFSQGPP